MKLPLQLSERKSLLIVLDILLVTAGVLLALLLWALKGGYPFNLDFIRPRIHWLPLLTVTWIALAFLNGFYDVQVAANHRATLFALLRVVGFILVVYLPIYFFAPPQRPLPRGIVLYHAGLSFVLVGAWRAVYPRVARVALQRHALVVGAGWAGRTIVEAIQQHPGGGCDVLGLIDDDPAKQGTIIAGLPVLGTCHDLVDLVRGKGIHQVILAITHNVEDDLFRALMACQEQGVEITPMPVAYEEVTGKVPIEHVGDNWLAVLPLEHPGVSGFFPIVKRGFDVAVSLVGLTMLGLLFPAIALALYIDSPGPIFYRQERVGRAGGVFRVFKLRSMIPDAERDGEAVWAKEGDPRVTRVGRMLRSTHLDEFPQFINILKSDMSVVGPRPERPAFVAELEEKVPFYRLRHAVKPGMAGWALVNHGYSSSVEDAVIKVGYDLYYIKHQSLYLDVVILFKTLLDMVTLGGR